MPKITNLEFNPLVLSLSVERDAKRSKGLHLSTIIRDRLQTAGIERATKGRPFTKEEQHLIFERGFLWERMVKEYCETEEWLKHQLDESASQHFAKAVAELPSNVVRPGECMLDDVYMTPDAIDMTNFWVEEWKATAIRRKGFDIEARKPEWLWQAGSYAHVFGMTRVAFRVWHVSDNIINSILVEWSPEEMRESWRRIIEHRDFMRYRDGRNLKC